MKNNCIILVLLIGVLNPSTYLFGQSNIVFGSSGVQHEDTLYIGDTVHFNFWLVNQGSSILNDSITVNCETFDFFGTSISSMSIGSSYNTSGSLAIGDSLYVAISETVTYQSYVLGDNIVVIWPASIAPGTLDTSITHIHILDSLTTNTSFTKLSNISLAPNPVVENLYLFNERDFPISSIIIYDCLGNLLFNQNNIALKDFIFNTRLLKRGIYFIVISSYDKKITKKFIVN